MSKCKQNQGPGIQIYTRTEYRYVESGLGFELGIELELGRELGWVLDFLARVKVNNLQQRNFRDKQKVLGTSHTLSFFLYFFLPRFLFFPFFLSFLPSFLPP